MKNPMAPLYVQNHEKSCVFFSPIIIISDDFEFRSPVMQKQTTPIVACVYNAFTTGNPFWGDNSLDVSMGRDVGGL